MVFLFSNLEFSAKVEYNRDQMIAIQLPDADFKTLLTKHGNLGKGYYYCPRSNKKFLYNDADDSVSDISDYIPESPVSDLRRPLEDAVSAYVKDFYIGGHISVYDINEPAGRCIAVCITSEAEKSEA